MYTCVLWYMFSTNLVSHSSGNTGIKIKMSEKIAISYCLLHLLSLGKLHCNAVVMASFTTQHVISFRLSTLHDTRACANCLARTLEKLIPNYERMSTPWIKQAPRSNRRLHSTVTHMECPTGQASFSVLVLYYTGYPLRLDYFYVLDFSTYSATLNPTTQEEVADARLEQAPSEWIRAWDFMRFEQRMKL